MFMGVSISQSGFWWVERGLSEDEAKLDMVSIPQSGFWWVEPDEARSDPVPSHPWFQSPSRDSGGLNRSNASQ